MTRKLVIVVAFAVLAAGCTAGRAFHRGLEAVQVADWDRAVEAFREAVQANPDNAEYKVELERAQEAAARMHIERAKTFETKDQLDAALIEYRRALELDNSSRLVAAKIAELEKTIRERIEA